jgi:predicted CXXCH cytochrome family protein
MREKRVALVLRSSDSGLKVKLNGQECFPFLKNDRYKDFAHGWLDLVPGQNTLVISAGASSQSLNLQYITYPVPQTKAQEIQPHVFFHLSERENRCAGCHPMTIDERTRKPAAGTDSMCLPCHKDKVSSAFLHGPTGSFRCLACHDEQPDAGQHRFAVQKQGADLCAGCHKSPPDLSQSAFVHGPASIKACYSCHNPHGSSQRFQLIKARAELCAGCHVEYKGIASGETPFIHQIIKKESCNACHLAHASEYKALLKKPMNELCYECHKRDVYVPGLHPVPKHPMAGVPDPLNPGKEMTCASCHDPHAGKTSKLFRAPDYTELCQLCHKY